MWEFLNIGVVTKKKFGKITPNSVGQTIWVIYSKYFMSFTTLDIVWLKFHIILEPNWWRLILHSEMQELDLLKLDMVTFFQLLEQFPFKWEIGRTIQVI